VSHAPQTLIVDTEAKRERAARLVSKLPLDGLVWDITVKEYEPKRSVDANRRLWALHQLAANVTGHSVEEMHEICKLKFLPRGLVKVGDEQYEVAGSSAKLTRKKFGEFMEQCESFYIQELGVFLGDQ